MEQKVNQCTRNLNILDLSFSNDHNLIIDSKVIINRNLSDHNTIIHYLSYDIAQMERSEKVNLCQTEIPEYNLMDGDDEDWTRMNLYLEHVDWLGQMEDKSVDEKTDVFLRILNDRVKQVFKRRDENQSSFSTSQQSEEDDSRPSVGMSVSSADTVSRVSAVTSQPRGDSHTAASPTTEPLGVILGKLQRAGSTWRNSRKQGASAGAHERSTCFIFTLNFTTYMVRSKVA